MLLADASTSDAFWLSRKCCAFSLEPQPGQRDVRVGVPDWLAAKHRQLVGDEKFEAAKQERNIAMAEQRELSGVLSRNTKRENDRQPEFKGSATIHGVAYWLAAWVKEGPDGKFFSLSFKRKDDQSTQVKPSAPAAPYKTKQLEDEVPF